MFKTSQADTNLSITNEQNKINMKKIKYKLKNIPYDEYTKNFVSGCFKAEIECSYDFLIAQYGKPFITKNNSTNTNKIRASWYIKVKTSNNFEYYIDIYDWEQSETKLEDVNKWCIGGSDKPCEYLDWDKLLKLFKFQFNNYNKKIEKQKQKEQSNKTSKLNISNTQKVQEIQEIPNEKFIDIEKYKKLDNEKLKEFTDDELACVLFTRFKETENFLLKEALIIHRALEDPENYNKTTSKNFSSNQQKSNYKNNLNNTKKNIVKKDKSKYNNKKDKSKYNNKK